MRSFDYLFKSIQFDGYEKLTREIMNFEKSHGMTLRNTRKGQTMYAMVTVRDDLLLHALRTVSDRTGKSPTTVLGKFIQDAFDAGITPSV